MLVSESLIARFGEGLDPTVLDFAYSEVASCDLFVTIGTSSAVHPAAGFAAMVRCIVLCQGAGCGWLLLCNCSHCLPLHLLERHL